MKSKYSALFLLVVSTFLAALFSSCQKDYIAPVAPASRSFIEEFDTVANLYSKGWVLTNNSKPQGIATWQQGYYTVGFFGIEGFPAFSYQAAATEYAFVYYDAGNNISTLSSWMITPPLEMRNGDKFSFYTRGYPGAGAIPDRLQVRLNASDNTADVGFTENSVGKFTTLLADINSALSSNGYPSTWTKYEFTISGLPNTLLKRRIALRYFVPDGGPNGINSFAIGVDRFEFTAN